MRRTLADARRSFEQEWLPRLSDHQARQGRQVLDQAEAEARQRAEAFMADREAEIRQARDSALRSLTEARDALEALAAQGAEGRMPAEEYERRLHSLRSQQAWADAQLDQAEEKVTLIGQIEADPLAWFDELTRRTGTTRDYPW
jgi:hypothetical protein